MQLNLLTTLHTCRTLIHCNFIPSKSRFDCRHAFIMPSRTSWRSNQFQVFVATIHSSAFVSPVMFSCQAYTSRRCVMTSVSSKPALEREVILISGGVESTTMLHMRHQTITKALQQDNARTENPTPFYAKDFIVPLFIDYGMIFSHSLSPVVSGAQHKVPDKSTS